MGYKRKQKTYRLVFQDPGLEGLEVRVRSVPVDQLMLVGDLLEKSEANDPAALSGLLDILAASLVGWNLENEDGTPVPATREALGAEDVDLVLQIIDGWNQAIAGVPGPLGSGSPSGASFPEASLPMAALSPSPAS